MRTFVLSEWLGSGALLAVTAFRMIRAIRTQTESSDEVTSAILAYAAPIPGAIIMTIGPFGITPLVFFAPGLAYFYILLVTHGQPLLMLGHAIPRVDRKESDRIAGRLIGLIILTVLAGVVAYSIGESL
jgi:hypothetical protein